MSASTNVQYCSRRAGPVRGRLRVPGDKSISHRSLMLGAIAEGVTEVTGFLPGEDCRATLQAFRELGVTIDEHQNGELTIHGAGLHGLRAPSAAVDLGNSGTAMRLLAGLLCAQRFDTRLLGDASLSTRPMRRVTDPLQEMGASIETSANGTPPLAIRGGQTLRGIDYRMPMASAQVKSALMLAALYADGETTITEPAPTRDHTERMLSTFGYPLEYGNGCMSLRGGGTLQGAAIAVPADISSAAFFLVAASITPDSDLTLEQVGVNPTRNGVITILRQMGADIDVLNARTTAGEPVADLRVRGAALEGIAIDPELVPLAIDEFPVLFVAAACAAGETVLTGAEELRVKESDRIQVMADGLQHCGIDARPSADGIVITGGELQGGQVQSHGDHRIAMAFAVAGLRARDAIIIDDCANVATSFPGFAERARAVGFDLEVVESG